MRSVIITFLPHIITRHDNRCSIFRSIYTISELIGEIFLNVKYKYNTRYQLGASEPYDILIQFREMIPVIPESGRFLANITVV